MTSGLPSPLASRVTTCLPLIVAARAIELGAEVGRGDLQSGCRVAAAGVCWPPQPRTTGTKAWEQPKNRNAPGSDARGLVWREMCAWTRRLGQVDDCGKGESLHGRDTRIRVGTRSSLADPQCRGPGLTIDYGHAWSCHGKEEDLDDHVHHRRNRTSSSSSCTRRPRCRSRNTSARESIWCWRRRKAHLPGQLTLDVHTQVADRSPSPAKV